MGTKFEVMSSVLEPATLSVVKNEPIDACTDDRPMPVLRPYHLECDSTDPIVSHSLVKSEVTGRDKRFHYGVRKRSLVNEAEEDKVGWEYSVIQSPVRMGDGPTVPCVEILSPEELRKERDGPDNYKRIKLEPAIELEPSQTDNLVGQNIPESQKYKVLANGSDIRERQFKPSSRGVSKPGSILYRALITLKRRLSAHNNEDIARNLGSQFPTDYRHISPIAIKDEKYGDMKSESLECSVIAPAEEMRHIADMTDEDLAIPQNKDRKIWAIKEKSSDITAADLDSNTDDQNNSFTLSVSPDFMKCEDNRERTITKDKPYKCSLCANSFAKQCDIHRHTCMRTHTGEKAYKCSLCEYRCNQKGSIVSHMRGHTSERSQKCSLCPFKCAKKSSLLLHVRRHKKENSYTCSMCDYKSPVYANLLRHIRTHTGEKPFACPECDYRSAYKRSLQTHIRKTHREATRVFNV